MADCPNCEYHKNRAARWRAEAYKQAGHDVIELPWVGLTAEEVLQCWEKAHEPGNKEHINAIRMADEVEQALKEKNT